MYLNHTTKNQCDVTVKTSVNQIQTVMLVNKAYTGINPV